MSEQYYLPKTTAERINAGYSLCKNLGLILDKYPPRRVLEKLDGESSSEKSDWLKTFASNNRIDTQLLESVALRWRATLAAMQAKQFTATTDWRIVVGLGGETVLETDLMLHHLYGIPVIPGSALKGLTRAYVTSEVEEHKSKKLEDDKDDVQRIFGTQEKSGSVLFFDALPIGPVEIDLDIMNAHYPKYYGEKKLPTNDQNPNPITFLTVTNTTFLFALAPRHPKDTQHEADVKTAQGWLQDALQRYGVGGKTSAGYGYFKLLEGQVSAPTSSQQVQQLTSIPYMRPNMPQFVTGQIINGTVVSSTDELRQRVPDAKAFLRFREFSLKTVLIVVNAEEAMTWTSGQTRNCVFASEEEHDGCTVLICQPGVSKKKKG